MVYQSIVWLVLNFKMNQKHKEYPKTIPRPNQQNNKIDCIFRCRKKSALIFCESICVTTPFPQQTNANFAGFAGPGGCQSQQMLLGKHRGRWRFPMELDRYQNEQCWAMEKTWLFRLNKGLYYPIIWEFLEENMGNFWEFWNLDFVFLVPSLCRYSKTDLSDFAKKTIIWEFLEENMGSFWEFWNLDFVFLVPSLCRYSKQDLSDFAKKTNYMGISWRKHGQLLRIFGTWILFFWFLHYAAIQNRIFLILQKNPIIWEFLEENMGNFWEFLELGFCFFGSFTMPLFKTGSFWFCKKNQLYGNFLKKTWATFENFWNLDFVFLVPSLCRYSKQDLSDFAKNPGLHLQRLVLVTWIDMSYSYQLAEAFNLSCHLFLELCSWGGKEV